MSYKTIKLKEGKINIELNSKRVEIYFNSPKLWISADFLIRSENKEVSITLEDDGDLFENVFILKESWKDLIKPCIIEMVESAYADHKITFGGNTVAEKWFMNWLDDQQLPIRGDSDISDLYFSPRGIDKILSYVENYGNKQKLIDYISKVHEFIKIDKFNSFGDIISYLKQIIVLSSVLSLEDQHVLSTSIDIDKIKECINHNVCGYDNLLRIGYTYEYAFENLNDVSEDKVFNLHSKRSIFSQIMSDLNIIVYTSPNMKIDDDDRLYIGYFDNSVIDFTNVYIPGGILIDTPWVIERVDDEIEDHKNIKIITRKGRELWQEFIRGCEEIVVDNMTFHPKLSPILTDNTDNPVVLITGDTGSGKTYQTIENYAKENFIYLAPCRQLVYETYMKYARKEDNLSTGEVKIINRNFCNSLFAVYESVMNVDLSKYKSLIIDEAHFIGDSSRGGGLVHIINNALKIGLKIYLVTATLDVDLSRLGVTMEHIHLENKHPQPKKIEVDYSIAYERMMNRVPTIIFISNINEAESKARELSKETDLRVGCIHANINPFERLKMQIDFQKGLIDTIVSTDVLAQGVNFTCSNMIIYSNEYDTPTRLMQKIGRLGRPFTSVDSEVTYYIDRNFNGIIIKKEKNFYDNISNDPTKRLFNKYIEEYGTLESVPEYNDIKYCISDVEEYLKNYPISELSPHNSEVMSATLRNISSQRHKIKDLLVTNMNKE